VAAVAVVAMLLVVLVVAVVVRQVINQLLEQQTAVAVAVETFCPLRLVVAVFFM
jgi:hypothetical protein